MIAVASPVLLLAFWSPGPGEMFLLVIIALILYGGELPDKAREWGKMFAEFRRGLSGVQNELNTAIYSEPPKPQRLQHYPEFRDVEPVEPSETEDSGDEVKAESAGRDGDPTD